MDYCIAPACATSDKDGIWFIDREYTILFFWDKKSHEITKAEKIPCENLRLEYAFLDMKCVGNKIVMAPNKSKEIVIYNKESNSFEKICIKNPKVGNFRKIYNWNEKLIIVPNYYERMIRLDMDKINVSYGDRWNKVTNENYIQASCISEKFIYAVRCDEIIMRYNLDLDIWDKQYFFNNMKISAITVKDDNLYLFDINASELFCFNVKQEKIVAKQSIGEKSVKLYNFFDEYIWLDEVYGSSYWIFDMNLSFEKKEKKIIEDGMKGGISCFTNSEFDEEVYEITESGFINVYDANLTRTINVIKLNQKVKNIIKDSLIDYVHKSYLDGESKMLYESRLVKLRNFLDVLI